MPQKLRPRAYNRAYSILYLTNNGEILHQTTTNADTRAEAKQYALKYAADAHIQYGKMSIRQGQYDHEISIARYMERQGVDPLDSKRTVIQVTVTLRQKQKMQKIYELTGLSVRHFTDLVRSEVDRLYDMYFDNEGKVRKLNR